MSVILINDYVGVNDLVNIVRQPDMKVILEWKKIAHWTPEYASARNPGYTAEYFASFLPLATRAKRTQALQAIRQAKGQEPLVETPIDYSQYPHNSKVRRDGRMVVRRAVLAEAIGIE